MRAEKRALEVDRHHALVLRLRRIEYRCTRFDPRIVDHDIQPAELADRRIDQLLEVSKLAHVGFDAQRLIAELADLALERLGRFRMRHVVDDDARTLAGELQHNGLAYTAVTASNDRDLVLQRHAFVLEAFG